MRRCGSTMITQAVMGELSGYGDGARPIYEKFQERRWAGSDLIVDGTLRIDLIVGIIRSEMTSRWERAGRGVG